MALNFPDAPALGQSFDDWMWDGTKWTLASSGGVGGTGVITGEIREFASVSCVPLNWLICDGVPKSRTTYPALFAKIGTTWGAGDGSTTFGIPNFVDRFARGSNAAGSNAGTVGGSADSVVVTHNHTQDGHNHGQNAHNHTQDQHMHQEAGRAANTQNNYMQRVGTAGSNWDFGPASVRFDSVVNPATTYATATNQAATATSIAATATNQAAGVAGTNANLPPFGTVVVAIFAGVTGGTGSGNPVGTVIDFYGTTAPSGHLVCDGSTFDGVLYPALAAHLGGTTLPDLRDKSTIGVSGTAALGTSKGSANSSVPQHQHASTLAAPDHSHVVDPPNTPLSYPGGSEGLAYTRSYPGYGPEIWVQNVQVVAIGMNYTVNGSVDIPAFWSQGANNLTLTGAIGNVSGATAAVAGANYHPVMAMLKCMKAV